MPDELHNCESENQDKAHYGKAVSGCWEDPLTKKLWVGNSEYANTVNYCPFCGFKSKN